MREAVCEHVYTYKIVAIIRGIPRHQCMQAIQALYDGGIRMAEITFNQREPDTFRDTAQMIADAVARMPEDMLLGAGTVTTPALVELAAEAGAKYIISPDTKPDVIGRTRELGLVSMPGALTPTEVTAAYSAGADFVKLFPVADLGLSYAKSVMAPLNHVPMMAVGGVNADNIRAFLDAGFVGMGVGGNLVNRQWIQEGRFEQLTVEAKKLVAAIQPA